MELDLGELASRLDDVVRNVPGVSALYSSEPAIVSSVRQIGSGRDSSRLVSVRAAGDGYEVVANIGVVANVQGPQTAAAVSAALLAAVPTGLLVTVHVRVSRVL